MKGEVVLVRSFWGAPVLMRVWDDNATHVALVPPDVFEDYEAGRSDLEPVGFPRLDVFKFDRNKDLQLDNPKWETLERY